jgi:MoaA/NifB/PqqE/SkfB family radical SAM enzyme
LRAGTPRPELSADQIVRAAHALGNHPGAFVLAGGDPLRRADLLEILQEVTRLRPAHLGLHCSGRDLAPALVRRLHAAGVQRLHVPFHSARQDAHDWLVGETGALKATHRAIRACVASGMPVVAEVTITRPTTMLLTETVDVLTRLGVRRITLRRLTAGETDGVDFIPLSPRCSRRAWKARQKSRWSGARC